MTSLDKFQPCFKPSNSGHCCLVHHRLYNREWARNNYANPKVKQRREDERIKRVYGLSIIDLKTLFNKQNSLCAICFSHTKLHIDHCHKTSKIRGLLCIRCNTALGNFNDDIKLLNRAIHYLNGQI